jgi:hypothetical protein
MPSKKKKKQQKKKQTLPNETRHRPFGIKKWLQKQNNIKGETFTIEPFSYEKLEKTLEERKKEQEELKKEELKNKLKLRYKEISRKNVEVRRRYNDLKRNRPPSMFIPKDKRGWHEEYEKLKKQEENLPYSQFKKDRLTFHRKATAFPGILRRRGIEFRDSEDSNSDYDLNYSEGDKDKDINVNDVLDKDIFVQPHINKPPKSMIQHKLDNYLIYAEGDPRLLPPPHNEIIDDVYFEPEAIDNEISFFINNLENENNDYNMKNHKEAETNQPLHPETIYFLKPNDNNKINQSINVNNNINEDIDNVVDDIYFEPEVS